MRGRSQRRRQRRRQRRQVGGAARGLQGLVQAVPREWKAADAAFKQGTCASASLNPESSLPSHCLPPTDTSSWPSDNLILTLTVIRMTWAREVG